MGDTTHKFIYHLTPRPTYACSYNENFSANISYSLLSVFQPTSMHNAIQLLGYIMMGDMQTSGRDFDSHFLYYDEDINRMYFRSECHTKYYMFKDGYFPTSAGSKVPKIGFRSSKDFCKYEFDRRGLEGVSFPEWDVDQIQRHKEIEEFENRPLGGTIQDKRFYKRFLAMLSARDGGYHRTKLYGMCPFPLDLIMCLEHLGIPRDIMLCIADTYSMEPVFDKMDRNHGVVYWSGSKYQFNVVDYDKWADYILYVSITFKGLEINTLCHPNRNTAYPQKVIFKSCTQRIAPNVFTHFEPIIGIRLPRFEYVVINRENGKRMPDYKCCNGEIVSRFFAEGRKFSRKFETRLHMTWEILESYQFSPMDWYHTIRDATVGPHDLMVIIPQTGFMNRISEVMEEVGALGDPENVMKTLELFYEKAKTGMLMYYHVEWTIAESVWTFKLESGDSISF